MEQDIKELILELQSFDIEFLVDIRSKPYSKFYTHFNQGFLKYSVEEYHIKYGYMGDLLGGLPLDRTCYTDGKVDYNKLKLMAMVLIPYLAKNISHQEKNTSNKIWNSTQLGYMAPQNNLSLQS